MMLAGYMSPRIVTARLALNISILLIGSVFFLFTQILIRRSQNGVTKDAENEEEDEVNEEKEVQIEPVALTGFVKLFVPYEHEIVKITEHFHALVVFFV